MTPPYRGRIFNQSIVHAPAAEVWAVLIDWAATHKLRRPGVDQGALTLEKVELEGDPHKTPRTRVLYFGALGVVRETLLHQDDSMMHLYYNMDASGLIGISNYLATTDVDAIAPDVCQITVTARYDINADADLVRVKNVIDSAHINGVIRGIQYYTSTKTG